MSDSHQLLGVHVVNEQMTETINMQKAAVLHYSLHVIFMPYFIMFPKHIAQIKQVHVLKAERSEVSNQLGDLL